MKGLLFICVSSLLIATILTSWGPFPSCGPEKPVDSKDCDRYSTETDVGCCLVTPSNSTIAKSCVLIGGKKAQTYLNKLEIVSLKNLSFPQDAVNVSEAIANNYTDYINRTYGEGSYDAKLFCLGSAEHISTLTGMIMVILTLFF
jgi:hypothetical protein